MDNMDTHFDYQTEPESEPDNILTQGQMQSVNLALNQPSALQTVAQIVNMIGSLSARIDTEIITPITSTVQKLKEIMESERPVEKTEDPF
jgi:hypothetical protein